MSARRYTGKTTAGRILQTEMGFELIALADAAKQACADHLSIPVGEFYDPTTKEDRRPALIQYCDRERQRDPDVFVKGWCERLYCQDKLACDDPRLPNEFEAFQLLGAKFIRIKASWDVRTENGYIPDGCIDNHPTETYAETLPDSYFSAIVENLGVGYFDKFQEDILNAVSRVMGERRSLI